MSIDCRILQKVELMNDFRVWLKTDEKTLKKQKLLNNKILQLNLDKKLDRYTIEKKVDYYIYNENKRYISENKQKPEWINKFPFMVKPYAYKFENYMTREIVEEYIKSIVQYSGKDYSTYMGYELADHMLGVINNYYQNNGNVEIDITINEESD